MFYSWEEGQELSLFGGEDLLLSLGSPLEPEALSPVQYDVKGAVPFVNNLPTTIKAECLPSTIKAECLPTTIKADNGLQHRPNAGDAPVVFSDDWLDTQLDLQGLLQFPAAEQKPKQLAPAAQSPVSYLGGQVFLAPELLGNFVDSSLDMSPSPIDLDLSGLEQPGQDSSQLLTEVFNKLVEFVGQDVTAEGAAVSSLPEHSTLSPVSVDDIESILSDPSSPVAQAVPSSGPSELELLLTSGQVTPVSQPNSGQVTPYSLPSTSFSAASSDTESEYSPVRSRQKRQRSKPYTREKQPTDTKERKKVQNKNAALKYRQKKRNEENDMYTECDQLEERNKQLKDKVESMSREIQYLKDLMAEVLVARQSKSN